MELLHAAFLVGVSLVAIGILAHSWRLVVIAILLFIMLIAHFRSFVSALRQAVAESTGPPDYQSRHPHWNTNLLNERSTA